MKKTIIILLILLFSCYLLSIAAATDSNLKIVITGISDAVLENVQNRLQLQLPKNKILTANDISQFHQTAAAEIKTAMMPFGYFKPQITARLWRNNGVWTEHFYINPGPPLRITALSIIITGEGANDIAFIKLKSRLPLKQGQIFSAQNYNNAKQSLYDLAASRGYLTAKMLTNVIHIDTKRYFATITIKFDTGPRYQFGPVIFSPNPFDTDFLRRYLPFTTGDPYSAGKIQELQQSLNNSDYFQRVLVTPKMHTEKNLQVPIMVELTPKKSQQYLAGIGFGTDTGVRALLGWELRRVTNTGQKFNAQILASQVINTVDANYIIPGKKPATEQYVFSAGVSQENEVNGTGNLQKIGASYIKVIRGWQQNISLTLQREQFTITNNPQQTALLLIPSIRWSKTSSDNELKPTKGYHLDLTLLGASSSLLSNTDFFQAVLNAKTIQSFTKRDRLVLRGSLGYTAIQNVNNLPLSFQLFAGGAQSIRGYGFNSIGPGTSLVVISGELQHRVYKDWYGTAFYDAGNVSNSFTNKLVRSAGVGVLWQSPVGAFELSLARPLDIPGHPISIEFSMGSQL